MPFDGVAEHRPGGTALRPITPPRALIGCLSLAWPQISKIGEQVPLWSKPFSCPSGRVPQGCRPGLPTLRHDQDRRCAHEPASRCRRPTRAKRLVRPLSRCV